MAKRPNRAKRRQRQPRRAAAPAKRYVSTAPLDLRALGPEFARADLEFESVDHSGPSFEARIFVDNPKADHDTPRTTHQGYAGAFHIFGHGGCFGDVGHCEVSGTRRMYDPRPAHPLTPARRKVVIVTDTIRRLVSQGKTSVTLTVVPVVMGTTRRCDRENVLKFDRVSLVTYQ